MGWAPPQADVHVVASEKLFPQHRAVSAHPPPRLLLSPPTLWNIPVRHERYAATREFDEDAGCVSGVRQARVQPSFKGSKVEGEEDRGEGELSWRGEGLVRLGDTRQGCEGE